MVTGWSEQVKSKKEALGEKKTTKGKGKKAKKVVIDSDSDMEQS